MDITQKKQLIKIKTLGDIFSIKKIIIAKFSNFSTKLFFKKLQNKYNVFSKLLNRQI